MRKLEILRNNSRFPGYVVADKPAGTLPGSKASALSRRGMKGPLLRNLAMDIRQQKSREGIYRNLFPDL